MEKNIKLKTRIVAASNIIAFLFVIVMNYLAISLPLNNKTTGQLSDQYPNMFTPAGFTFSIWSVIYLCLLGFIIYQAYVLIKLKPIAEKVAAITPLFILNCLANGSWLFAWHYEKVGLSVAIMLVMLLTLIFVHEKLKLALPIRPVAQKLFLDIPFSLYLGWISIATIANVTTLFVDQSIQPFGISATVWTVIMIGVGTLLAVFMIAIKNNYVFGLVVAWAFFGIVAKRLEVGNIGSREIILACQVCIGFIIASIFLAVMKSSKKKREV